MWWIATTDCFYPYNTAFFNYSSFYRCSASIWIIWLWPLCYSIYYGSSFWGNASEFLFRSKENEESLILFKCLENKNMTLFPTLRKRRIRQSMIKAVQEVAIHCACRMPEMGKFMIECTNCKQWFHVSCYKNIPKKAFDSKKSWLCCNCK